MKRRGEDFNQLYMPLDAAGHPKHLRDPLGWKTPGRIFWQDMGDLFDSRVPDTVIDLAFEVIREATWHTHLILTKRVNRMQRYLRGHMSPPGGALFAPTGTELGWWPLPNVWIGTSVEDPLHWARVTQLKSIPIHPDGYRFVSAEPLLEPLGRIDLSGIHQVIVGGESGAGFRPMPNAAPREVRDECIRQNTGYFYKQGAAFYPGRDRELDGRLWEEPPRRSVDVR